MKTIYNTYVVMESQEQCDRMKQLCIDNGLPYWDDETAFDYTTYNKICSFNYDIDDKEFYTINPYNEEQWYLDEKLTEITEQEFIELIKTTKQ